MAFRVYGPDAFTVGSDQSLQTYDANWKDDADSFGNTGRVQASTDDVRDFGGAHCRCYWNGVVSVDQKIVATIKQGPSTNSYPGLVVRRHITDVHDGYLVQWSNALGVMRLYRVVGGTYTQVQDSGSVSSNTTYTNAFVQAITVGSTVVVKFGDDINGTFTFTDSDAARILTGQAGLDIFEGTDALSSGVDDVEIWDLDLFKPTAGALSLTGIAPVVTIGGGGGSNTTITPTVGTLVLTGIAPLVTRQNIITPLVGTLVLTGAAPLVTLQIYRIPVAGALVLNGAAPVVSSFGNITPQAGALTLTGFAPGVIRQDTITPGTGALVLSGAQAGVSLGIMRTPVAGALVLSGVAPGVTVERVISPLVGALSLTGAAPVVISTASYMIIPGTGSLVLNGQSLQGSLVPAGAYSILLVPARTTML